LLVALVAVTATLLCRFGGRFGVGELRGGLLHGDLEVTWVDLDECGAGLDLLVVFDRHTLHRAADARGDLHHVRLDLRIVGRLLAAGQPQPDTDADEQHRKYGNRKTEPGHWRGPPR